MVSNKQKSAPFPMPKPRNDMLRWHLLTLLGLVGIAQTAGATTRTVNTCSDTGKVTRGIVTLRQALNAAVSGDAIDMSQLGACTITLLQGEIVVSQDSLTFSGAASGGPTIDAGGTSRVIDHVGAGTLVFENVNMAHGKVPVIGLYGGCVYSSGSLNFLANVSVSACNGSKGSVYAHGSVNLNHSSVTGAINGGGVSAGGSVSLYNSTVSGNSGGGIAANQKVYAHSSVIAGNSTTGNGGGISAQKVNLYYSDVVGNSAAGAGGGIFAWVKATLTSSTVSGNSTNGPGGGIYAPGTAGPSGGYLGYISLNSTTIDSNSSGTYGGGIDSNISKVTNSTISGNTASNGGGIATFLLPGLGPALYLYNSTVAFNHSTSTKTLSSGGIYSEGDLRSVSSIIARNVVNPASGSTGADISLGTNATLSASFDIIMSSNPFSAASIHSDPQLTPLADHGGGLRTHAPLATSPAVWSGSNPQNLPYDERGFGFPRSILVDTTRVDIGAYQRQLGDDELFYGGFD